MTMPTKMQKQNQPLAYWFSVGNTEIYYIDEDYVGIIFRHSPLRASKLDK